MSREEVIRRIVDRQNGKRPLLEEPARRDDPELHAAAVRHFGTWDTALRYAGISLRRLRHERIDSADQVRRTIIRQSQRFIRLMGSVVARRRPRLYRSALRHFGSWNQALAAAGIDPRHVRPFAAGDRPSRARTLELLTAWHRASGSLQSWDLCRANTTLAIHVHALFGSFSNALFAARLIPQPKQRRGIAAWDAAAVIAGLQARQARGDARRNIWEQQPALACAAWHFFGGLDEAVAAAAVTE